MEGQIHLVSGKWIWEIYTADADCGVSVLQQPSVSSQAVQELQAQPPRPLDLRSGHGSDTGTDSASISWVHCLQ